MKNDDEIRFKKKRTTQQLQGFIPASFEANVTPKAAS
jgi:hypothetical protein